MSERYPRTGIRGIFSIDDFKRWIDDQGNDSLDGLRTRKRGVWSNLEIEDLRNVLRPEEGELGSLAESFYTLGGEIIDRHENDLMIRTDKGTFVIEKKYVRRNQ